MLIDLPISLKFQKKNCNLKKEQKDFDDISNPSSLKMIMIVKYDTHTHTVTYTLEYPWRLFPPWKDYSAVLLVLNIKISESFKI